MKYIINTDINIAQAEVNELNEKTKHLWKDDITKRLVILQANQYNNAFMYLYSDKYKEYYTPEMLSKAVDVLPDNWSDFEKL